MPFKVGDIAILRDCDEVAAEYKKFNYDVRGERKDKDFVYLPGKYGFSSYAFGHFSGSEVTIVETIDYGKDGIQCCKLQLPYGEQYWTSELMLTPVECGRYDFDERSFTSLLSGE